MRWVGRLSDFFQRTNPPQDSPATVAIVRRGLSPEYYFFFQIFARQHGLEVVVDRRVDERRRHSEHVFGNRRASDRRGPAPRTWDEADIVIPHPSPDHPDAPGTRHVVGPPPPQP